MSVARHYRTREDIGSFVLARENFNDLRSIYARWEDYAYPTPLWRKIFDQYGGALEDRVRFDNDNNQEAFYDSYGLEPDEQSKSTQQQSIAPIPIIPWISWHDALFEESCIIPFHEDFRFIL